MDQSCLREARAGLASREEELARLRRELVTSRQEKEAAESQGRFGKIFFVIQNIFINSKYF